MANDLGSMYPGSGVLADNPAGRIGAVAPKIADIYKATLQVQRDGGNTFRMSTPMPENFMIGLSTSWDTPFNQPLSNLAAGGRMGAAADVITKGVTATMGVTTLNKWLSAGVWSGGSMLKLDIPFVIQAYENPKEEVVKKMRDLLKFVAPSETANAFLRAPGPLVLSETIGTLGGDIITVSIGNFFTMTPCIIDSVTCTFDTQFDRNGDPIAATINVSVMSYFTTTQEDLMKFFAPSLGG